MKEQLCFEKPITWLDLQSTGWLHLWLLPTWKEHTMPGSENRILVFKQSTSRNTAVSAGLGRVEKCLKDPTYAIFLKSWGFRDVKCDIPMCQYHSTRPQPIQLVPTMQKKLFTLSFQPKFLKIRFTKVAASRSFLMRQQIFLFLLAKWSQGHVWANSDK